MKLIAIPFKTIAIVCLSMVMLNCSNQESGISQNENNPDNATQSDTNTQDDTGSIASIPGTIRNISSMQLIAEMGVGWNLGNSLDTESTDKTAWGNPLPSQHMIDLVFDMGFRTLRVPVTWRFNQQASAPYTIEEEYLNLVQETVNYGISKNMHVIINVHHDNTWIRPTVADAPEVNLRLGSLWTQVANRFRDYGDLLIFETLNENRLLNSPEEWTGGTQEGRTVLNQYHATALNAIRATGGNNTGRHIMISPYAASTIPIAMDGLEIPNNDERVIISLHTYFPWPFAGPDSELTQWGSPTERAELEAEFDRIRDKWIVQEQRPVILGEWGAVDKSNLSTREAYYEFYVSQSTARGLLPIVWDDGGNFRLQDRANLVWHFPTLPEIIVEAAN